jgi:predicted nicotinamide N-methyase
MSMPMNNDSTKSVTLTFMGKTFTLAQDPSSSNHGLCVWDASLCFLRYLEANPREATAIQGASVLELGAGTGVLGLALAHCLGARVVLTDLPSVLPNLSSNLAANPLPPGCEGSLKALEYAWDGSAPPGILGASPEGQGFHYIIGTDVGYSETQNPVLLASAAALARASAAGGRKATVIFVNELRCELAQAVFDKAAPEHFKVQRVPSKKLHPDFQRLNFLMTRMTLRKVRAPGEGEGGVEEAEEA